MNTTLAAIESKDLAAMVTFAIFFGGFFVLLIVKNLMRHQQRMVELMRMPRNELLEQEVMTLKSEVSYLRDRLNAITIKVDGEMLPPTPPILTSDPVETQRLRGSA